MRALIVEPDEGVRLMVEVVLEDAGYAIAERVADWRMALDLLSRSPSTKVDIIVGEPCADGWREFSQESRLRQPVLALTNDENVGRARATATLKKGCGPQDLLAAFKALQASA